MFQHLEPYAGDPILSLNEAFQKDPRKDKINLSIGIYFDDAGRIPVLDCVRQAEAQMLADSAPKSYLPIEGSAAARSAVQHLLFGAGHTLTQMGGFFTQAALLTFGGAYAVLPFVTQAAVVQYGWLTAAQMMDGLALGETTPGPLIMVVAFVGFLGGHSQALLGYPLLGGILAACVVTWFTFLPSFVFILAGGPLVESTRHMPSLTGPLQGITAAVIGVIVHLAGVFARQTWLPGGWHMLPDLSALLLTLLATWALVKKGYAVVRVLAACVVLGLLRYALL